MQFKDKLISFLLILFFSIGLLLGVTAKQRRGLVKKSPDKNENIERNIEDKTPITIGEKNISMISNDEEPDAPDERYYKKARALQREFPSAFIMEGTTQTKNIALTFDDGPDNKSTPQILDILGEYQIPATFFVVGENIKRYPKIAERIVNEGHQIANHSQSHLRPTELSNRELMLEVLPVEQGLRGLTNLSQSPFYYRPPYGLLTSEQIMELAKKGYIVISWSVDSLDWAGSTSGEIKDKVIKSSFPGAIILMHCAGGKDGRINTVKALPKIIHELIDLGYGFLTIDGLLDLG